MSSKTNVANTIETSSTIIHARYKDLSNVEWAFRLILTHKLRTGFPGDIYK